MLAGQTEAMAATVERAFESCEYQRCRLDDPSAVYDDVREEVESDPLPASGSIDVGPAELAIGTIFSTYDPELWPVLNDALADAAEGDGTMFWRLASGYYDIGDWTTYAAVMCLDSERPDDAEAWRDYVDGLRADSPRFGGTIGNELLPCAFWPVAPDDISGPVTAEDSPPILVVGNTGDAATPYENAVAVTEMLANGTLVTYRGEGHTSYGRDECIDEVIHRYLIDLEVPERDPQCPAGSSRGTPRP